MSQNNGGPAKPAKGPKPQSNGPATAEILQCKAEHCKSKPSKFGFCKDHYEMYMAGVIRGDGKKPIDYEEKLALLNKSKNAKAA